MDTTTTTGIGRYPRSSESFGCFLSLLVGQVGANHGPADSRRSRPWCPPPIENIPNQIRSGREENQQQAMFGAGLPRGGGGPRPADELADHETSNETYARTSSASIPLRAGRLALEWRRPPSGSAALARPQAQSSCITPLIPSGARAQLARAIHFGAEEKQTSRWL